MNVAFHTKQRGAIYLGAFAYRFNRRFDVAGPVVRLIVNACRGKAAPGPDRLIPSPVIEPKRLTVRVTVKPMPQVCKPNGDNSFPVQEMIEWEMIACPPPSTS